MQSASAEKDRALNEVVEATKFADLAKGWKVVEHISNTPTGFSGTLFKNNATDELVLSFRSTEYQLAGKGGDYERDGVNGTDGEISQKGFALAQLSSEIPVIFPVHPRTRQRIESAGLAASAPHLHLFEPLGYLDFLALQAHAALVLTDSGGIQEETTYLGIPCLTARPNTERPVTITAGTNRLVASTAPAILEAARQALTGDAPHPAQPPELWDGHAAERIAQIFLKL